MVLSLAMALEAGLLCRQMGRAAEEDLVNEYQMNGLYQANSRFAQEHYRLEAAVWWLMKENHDLKAEVGKRGLRHPF